VRKLILLLLILASWPASSWGDEVGAALFNSNCRPCHDGNGDGRTAGGAKMAIPDLRSADVQKLTDDDLYQRIGNGAKHKQYPHTFLKKGMTDPQLREVIGYIRLLKKN